MCAGSRTASRAFTLCAATRFEHYVSLKGNSPTLALYSRPNAADLSQRIASTGWSSGQHRELAFRFRRTHIAAPCCRLQARERWSRHAINSGLSWPSKHSAHCALHGVVTYPLQGFLARLNRLHDINHCEGLSLHYSQTAPTTQVGRSLHSKCRPKPNTSPHSEPAIDSLIIKDFDAN